MIKKYYDYKPIPKYKKGDKVYRRWSGLWFHHPEPISRVFVKEHQGKYYIEYYFPRERTPFAEEDLRETLEEQLKAEAGYVIQKALGELKHISQVASKYQINLGTSTAMLEQYREKHDGEIEEGNKVAMFLKLTFLEGKARKEFFRRFPPRRVYVASGRIKCAMNGDFDNCGSSVTAYAWFVWEKGYKGKTEIEWFN